MPENTKLEKSSKGKTKFVTLRIEEDLKTNVQKILKKLGLTESMAVHLFYKQVELQKGMPFDILLPDHTINKACKDGSRSKSLTTQDIIGDHQSEFQGKEAADHNSIPDSPSNKHQKGGLAKTLNLRSVILR